MNLHRQNVVVSCLAALFISCLPTSLTAEERHPAEGLEEVKSIQSNHPTSITFLNHSGGRLKLYWLNFEGERVLYYTLDKEESLKQQTYLTHPWLITDEDDNALYLYYPDALPRTIELSLPPVN